MSERETEVETGELGTEVPAEDAFEQHRPATRAEEDEDDELVEAPIEADPADRSEQGRVVEADEDEYR